MLQIRQFRKTRICFANLRYPLSSSTSKMLLQSVRYLRLYSTVCFPLTISSGCWIKVDFRGTRVFDSSVEKKASAIRKSITILGVEPCTYPPPSHGRWISTTQSEEDITRFWDSFFSHWKQTVNSVSESIKVIVSIIDNSCIITAV